MEFAKNPSPIAMTSCLTISIPRAWDQGEETTIPTIFRQLIGDAISKKDRRDCKREMALKTINELNKNLLEAGTGRSPSETTCDLD